MTSLTFTVPGKPQPKQRARRGRNGRWYTPQATRDYEREVSIAAWATIKVFGLPWALDARYRVTVGCFMPDKRKRDADNVAKSVLDGCNRVLWDDDSQVYEITVRKELDRENPRTVVTVEILE